MKKKKYGRKVVGERLLLVEREQRSSPLHTLLSIKGKEENYELKLFSFFFS